MKPDVVQPAGNFYDKYNTRNPIARSMMQGFLQAFMDLTGSISPIGTALEVGCGEGELSMRLARVGWTVQGCDIAPDAIAEALLRSSNAGLSIPFQTLDVFDAADVFEPSDLVVCCEVLEHLQDPATALEILMTLSRKYLLLSVPREPVWRALNMARGRYWGDLGNTPGHIQHWSRQSFLSLLERHTEVIAVRSPLPWTLALCRVQDR